MSFTAQVKEDISRVLSTKSCCRKAEFVGFFLINGSIKISGGVSLTMHTENSTAARKIYLLAKDFAFKPEISVYRRSQLKKNQVYQLSIPPQESIETFLMELGMITENAGWQYDFFPTVERNFLSASCCRRAYLRGAFLAAGSIADPAVGSYHLEFDSLEPKQADFLVSLLHGFALNAKIVRRKETETVYIKGAEQISDFMNIVGSHRSLLEFESVRVTKDVRNRANRLRNCDTANVNKTVEAASRQIEEIKLIDKSIGMSKLPQNLRVAAELRLENPEASLAELSQLSHLGRSALNHRFRRLNQIAYNIRVFGVEAWDK